MAGKLGNSGHASTPMDAERDEYMMRHQVRSPRSGPKSMRSVSAGPRAVCVHFGSDDRCQPGCRSGEVIDRQRTE
jgi:hypothetical protein